MIYQLSKEQRADIEQIKQVLIIVFAVYEQFMTQCLHPDGHVFGRIGELMDGVCICVRDFQAMLGCYFECHPE